MIHKIGSDEVGLGALAGPITVCAFMAPSTWTHPAVKDSKKYAQRMARELVAKMLLQDKDTFHCLVHVEADEIDRIGYSAALSRAHCDAIKGCLDVLLPQDKFDIVIDGNLSYPLGVPYRSEPKADINHKHVAAASVIAKVSRDRLMDGYAKWFPEYQFQNNSGYGTGEHLRALKQSGVTPIHRKSIRQVRDL